MTVWVVKATDRNYTYSLVDSVWSSKLEAEQRAAYIRDNDDEHGDWWSADVVEVTVDRCTAWPRVTRDR